MLATPKKKKTKKKQEQTGMMTPTTRIHNNDDNHSNAYPVVPLDKPREIGHFRRDTCLRFGGRPQALLFRSLILVIHMMNQGKRLDVSLDTVITKIAPHFGISHLSHSAHKTRFFVHPGVFAVCSFSASDAVPRSAVAFDFLSQIKLSQPQLELGIGSFSAQTTFGQVSLELFGHQSVSSDLPGVIIEPPHFWAHDEGQGQLIHNALRFRHLRPSQLFFFSFSFLVFCLLPFLSPFSCHLLLFPSILRGVVVDSIASIIIFVIFVVVAIITTSH
jgi:hypothetical protein